MNLNKILQGSEVQEIESEVLLFLVSQIESIFRVMPEEKPSPINSGIYYAVAFFVTWLTTIGKKYFIFEVCKLCVICKYWFV